MNEEIKKLTDVFNTYELLEQQTGKSYEGLKTYVTEKIYFILKNENEKVY